MAIDASVTVAGASVVGFVLPRGDANFTRVWAVAKKNCALGRVGDGVASDDKVDNVYKILSEVV